jgi:ketosteroid isomerase-like protein
MHPLCMTADENKHWLMTAWKTFGSRDAQRTAALFTEDAEWLAPPENATALALRGPHHLIGRERIAHFLAHEMHTLFSDIHVDIRGVYADGTTVILEERFRAQLPGGKPYENDYCFVFELDGQRIRCVREYMDTQRGKQLIFG